MEWSFVGLGVVFVFVSLWPSYKKVHRKSRPLLIAALGFGTLALGRLDFSEAWEVVHTVSGAIMVAAAHFINWKLLRFREDINIKVPGASLIIIFASTELFFDEDNV